MLGLPPNVAFALLAVASFLCCVPMAMPSSHIIALCGDLGLAPAKGAAMLTVLWRARSSPASSGAGYRIASAG